MANPDAAADWLRQSFADGPALDRGLAGVMQSWASTGDPATAAQWVTKLPAGPTRDHAFKDLIAAREEANPRTLKRWRAPCPTAPFVRRRPQRLARSLLCPESGWHGGGGTADRRWIISAP